MDVDADSVNVLGEHLILSILHYHPLNQIKSIIAAGAPLWYQSESEGLSPLHAAAYAQDAALTNYLIEQGAVWNAVDKLGHTAGDIALSFNNSEIYTSMRDAGIRSELLLAMLSDWDNDEPSNIILQETDDTAAGSSAAFLSSRLRFTTDDAGQDICSVDAGGQEVGVMMGWERKIMEETVKKLCQDHENSRHLKILNIGFGLGIIDGLFQALDTPPALHAIIEPHPDVLQHMRKLGYYDRPGVKILEGKWQDFIDKADILGIGGFDVIYTDTFSEDYTDLHKFFENLPNILSGPSSRFSFFNGLGATNLMFYDVYTHIAELHLAEVGIEVEWYDVDVSNDDSENSRWGQSREYFTLVMRKCNALGLNLDLYVMTIFSLYVYDRHCACVYYQDWHRTKRPRVATEGGILHAVSRAVTPTPTNATADANAALSNYGSPRNTLSSSTGVVVAASDASSQAPADQAPTNTTTTTTTSSSTVLPFDEEGKLVYGVVLSLRSMIKKLSGRDEPFVAYKTSTYKLHFYETLTGYKFIMLSDPEIDSLRVALRQIYAGPFIDYVVRNPLSTMDSRTHGIDNEYFRASVDRYVRGLLAFT
ncbi:hypothetical protein APHAL10511_004895 [Amanita phalloides]|nr:hypothetical protein APHAL10511_004895 [Amanita phalloides]